MATDVGADVVTNFISNNLADAAADASPGARTVSRPDRTTLEDANHSTLTTTQFYAFFSANFRAVVTTLASADDAAVTCSHRITLNNPETDVLRRQSATVLRAHYTTFRRTHYFTFSGTDAQENGETDHRADCVHQR